MYKIALLTVVAVALSACGGDSGSSSDGTNTSSNQVSNQTSNGTTATGDPIDGVTVDCRSPDSDSDGLPDCEEEVLGTAPRSDDTDGDGLSDFEEIIDRNFDPESNNFRFNPRIADLPRLSFKLTSAPEIQVHYTTSEGTTDTIGTERTQESARSVTTSETQEESHSVEESITTMSSISVLDAGFSVSGSLSESWGQSMSWSKSQTRENRTALSQTRETSRQQGTELTGGTLRVAFAIENRGYQSVTLESLVVAASYSDPANPKRFTPIANLDFESTQGFAPLEIPPNGSTSDQLIFSAELDLGSALSLLADTRNLSLRPAAWSAVDINARSFNAPLETIGTKCSRININYGPSSGLDSETYFVSSVTDFSMRTISVREALEGILRLPIEAGSGGVTSVRSIQADPSVEGRWVLVHTMMDGVEETSRIFDPNTNAADIDMLELRPGWVLQLTYIEDADGDGLLARSEFLAGSSDNNLDSDGDGLEDFFEAKVGWETPWILDKTRRVFSNPAVADIDIDGLNDAAEFAALTNPNEDDSDRDGIRDDFDSEPNNMAALATLLLNGDTVNTGSTSDWQNNGAQPTTDRFGRSGMAMVFDGTNSISTETLFPRVITTGASWSLWIRPDGLVPGETQGILDHDQGQAWNALWVSPEGIGGSGSSFGRHFIGLAEETGNVTGTWHHVVGVLADKVDEVNDAETFLIYYDGELRGEIASSPTISVEPGNWTIGAGVGRTSNPPFIGAVDDVRMYDRGLTAEEVQLLFEHRD